jgi:guanyl-specific ribonuclease Sa
VARQIIVEWRAAGARSTKEASMNRLVPSLLATAFLASTGGLALAANSNQPQTAAVNQSQAPAAAAPEHKAHPKVIAAAKREDRADPKEARMTHALNLLEANGYGQFSDFKQDGKNFEAMVTSNGQHFAVTIDPDSNRITRKS